MQFHHAHKGLPQSEKCCGLVGQHLFHILFTLVFSVRQITGKCSLCKLFPLYVVRFRSFPCNDESEMTEEFSHDVLVRHGAVSS